MSLFKAAWMPQPSFFPRNCFESVNPQYSVSQNNYLENIALVFLQCHNKWDAIRWNLGHLLRTMKNWISSHTYLSLSACQSPINCHHSKHICPWLKCVILLWNSTLLFQTIKAFGITCFSSVYFLIIIVRKSFILLVVQPFPWYFY